MKKLLKSDICGTMNNTVGSTDVIKVTKKQESAATVHELQPLSPTAADKKKKKKKEKENATQNADVRFITIQMGTQKQ